MSKNNRIVLITGSTQGIGLATAEQFLKNGDNVVILSHNEDEVLEVVEKFNHAYGSEKILGVTADVRKTEDVKSAVEQTLKKFGRIDVLVNNAGIAIWKPIEETTDDDWCNTIDINLKGPFLFMREVVPVMKKQGSGVIINISSASGIKAKEKFSAYSVSKLGLLGLTGSVANETKDDGIKVYTLLPGGADTELHRRIHPWEDFSKMLTPADLAEKIFETAKGEEQTGKSVEALK